MESRRVALITGSATGLGTQMAKGLALVGHHVVINYNKSLQEALLLQQEVKSFGVECILAQGDISIKEDCEKIVSETISHFGKLDILINNAGPYMFERKKLADYGDEEWNYIINGNLNAVFYLSKLSIPYMRKNKWGRIINFGFNEAGQASGWSERSAFAAAKVGLVSLTKTMSQEECEDGITVNMICPGDIKGTDKEKTIEDVKRNPSNHIAPIGRPGSGEDMSRVVVFLASEQSDFITGSIIEVNGGFRI